MINVYQHVNECKLLIKSQSLFLYLNCFPEDPEKGPKTVVDVGCGIGGSSRYIARKFGAKCQGITLSPFQAQRANALAETEGLADKVCVPTFEIFYINLPLQALQYKLCVNSSVSFFGQSQI